MTLKKIESLIALACSTTHEEEARTTALIAVRLIQKEKIKLSETAASPAQGKSYSSRANPPGNYSNAWSSTFDTWEIWKKVYEQQRAQQKARPWNPYGYYVPPEPPKSKPPPPGGTWLNLRRTPNGEPLKCAGCGKSIRSGERCYVTKDRKQVWCGEH